MTTTLNRIHNSVFQWRLNISWTIFGGRRLLQKWMKRSWHLQVPQFRGGRHSFLHLLISVSKAIEVTSWNKPRGSCLSGHDHEQGRPEGGGTGVKYPGPPIQGGPQKLMSGGGGISLLLYSRAEPTTGPFNPFFTPGPAFPCGGPDHELLRLI